MLDVKITGGTVIDGTGSPGVRADVGVRDGAVVEISRDSTLQDAEATLTIDATGRAVTPGFVDIHTHYDAQILWDRMLSVSPWHGVTTVVTGNCGFGVAPTRPEHRDLIVRTLEKVEGMSADALRAGLGDDWPFETFPEYLDTVAARGSAINVGVMIGHTPLRLATMGEESTERAATDDEIARMRADVAEAIAAGAIGFATSKSATHVGYAGRPVPSRAAEVAEISAIAEALGDAGTGVIQATMGAGFAFEEFAAISGATGRPDLVDCAARRGRRARSRSHAARRVDQAARRRHPGSPAGELPPVELRVLDGRAVPLREHAVVRADLLRPRR